MAATNIEESVTHTRLVMYRLKHTWVMDKFSNFYVANAESSTDTVYPMSIDLEYPRIASTPFTCSQDGRIQFTMSLYPKGVNEVSKDYISLYLELAFNEPANVPIKVKFSLLNDHNKRQLLHECTKVFSNSSTFGWDSFVKRITLFDKTYRLLANDQLTVLCEIEMYGEPVAKLAGNTCLEDLKSLSMAKNSEMYGNLLESGDHSDVVLVVNGKELKAHKAILSANSLVFKTMFEVDMKEKAEGRVAIEDLTFDVAKELLKFIYTGSVELRNCPAEELLSAADKYGLDLLKQICGQYLVGRVTTDNAARFLAYADAHSVNTLKRACMKYIRGHLVEVMLHQDWPLVGKLVIEKLRQEEGPRVKEEDEDDDDDDEDEEDEEEDDDEDEEEEEEELLPKTKKVKQG